MKKAATRTTMSKATAPPTIPPSCAEVRPLLPPSDGADEGEVFGTLEGMNLAATLGSSASRRGGAVGVVTVVAVLVDVITSPSFVVVILCRTVVVTGAVE